MIAVFLHVGLYPYPVHLSMFSNSTIKRKRLISLNGKSSAIAERPRDALSVQILSTAAEPHEKYLKRLAKVVL